MQNYDFDISKHTTLLQVSQLLFNGAGGKSAPCCENMGKHK